MAEYNNQSIDIDLEEIFNGLSDEDQKEFLTDMFTKLPDEETRKKVVKDNIWFTDSDTTIHCKQRMLQNRLPDRSDNLHRRHKLQGC